VGGIGPKNYSIIQEAINDASDGDTIFVYNDSSPYYESLVVDKSINLKGEDWESTIINSVIKYKSTIHVIYDWVNISGFTVREGYGGIRINANNNTISGNIVIDNGWGGVSLQNAKFNNITDNRIIYNFYGVQIYKKSNYNIISNNLIRNSLFLGIMIGNPIVPLKLIDKNYDPLFGNDDSKFNIIAKNTFYNPVGNAYFVEGKTNNWDGNYWGRPRIFPKIIRGYDEFDERYINIDWHPAFLPYHKLF
jgi:parallel beta-helix repeat protein